MIKILFKDTLSCPIFTCDICGDMIGDLGEGAAVFADLARRPENMKIDVLHVHKGKCHELAEQKMAAVTGPAWSTTRRSPARVEWTSPP